MRDNDLSHALGVEVFHDLKDFLQALGQCGCGFIIEHHPRVHCKRPRNGLWLWPPSVDGYFSETLQSDLVKEAIASS